MDTKKTINRYVPGLTVLILLSVFVSRAATQTTTSVATSDKKTYKESADLYFSSGDYNAALTGYNMALQFDWPNETMVKILFNKGICNDKIGQYDRAIKSFSEAVEYDKNNPELHLYLGIGFEKAGLTTESIIEYQKAIEYGTKDKFSACYGLGRIYQVIGLNSEAIANYTQALAISQDTDIYRSLSQCYELLHDWKSASSMLNQYLLVKPSTDDYIHLSFLFYIQADYDNAIEMLTQAGTRDPDRDDVRLHIAIAYYKKADYVQSGRILDSLIDQDKTNGLLHYLKSIFTYTRNNTGLSVTEQTELAVKYSGPGMVKTYAEQFLNFLR
jgi:tetratricopeptide (TPR) repeat protein